MTDLPTDLQTRPIANEDLPFLRDLYAGTREMEMANSGWNDEDIARFLTQQFEIQHRYYHEHYGAAHFLLIQVGGQAIGRLYWQWPEQGSELGIIDIALLPAWRGRGIGSYFLGKMMDQARERRMGVTLHVEHYNPALTLYHRLGFQKAGSHGAYFRLTWHDPELAEETH